MSAEERLPLSQTARYSLGALCVFVAFLIFAAALIDWLYGLPVRMPATWYYQRYLWLAAALGLIVVSWVLQAPPPSVDGWSPRQSGLRFLSLKVYGREECHLCDDAVDLLEKYQDWLPPIQLFSVDEDEELKEKFGQQVPVIEFDGKVRFRGRINVTLLQRLIEGTPPV